MIRDYLSKLIYIDSQIKQKQWELESLQTEFEIIARKPEVKEYFLSLQSRNLSHVFLEEGGNSYTICFNKEALENNERPIYYFDIFESQKVA